MIASWMIYSIMVALCFGVAASAAEHLIRLYGKPARTVWVVALVGSLLVPLVNWTVVNRADGVADGAAEFGVHALDRLIGVPILGPGFIKP